MKVGFTGTQRGMTPQQKAQVLNLLSKWLLTEFHHGQCIGADAEAHEIIWNLRKKLTQAVRIIKHPPKDQSKMAQVQVGPQDSSWPPDEYLKRNLQIVKSVDMLIATPKEFKEQLRSGTWATVRYADKAGVSAVLIFPDGSVSWRSK